MLGGGVLAVESQVRQRRRRGMGMYLVGSSAGPFCEGFF